jgi:hypothetical protein
MMGEKRPGGIWIFGMVFLLVKGAVAAGGISPKKRK